MFNNLISFGVLTTFFAFSEWSRLIHICMNIHFNFFISSRSHYLCYFTKIATFIAKAKLSKHVYHVIWLLLHEYSGNMNNMKTTWIATTITYRIVNRWNIRVTFTPSPNAVRRRPTMKFCECMKGNSILSISSLEPGTVCCPGKMRSVIFIHTSPSRAQSIQSLLESDQHSPNVSFSAKSSEWKVGISLWDHPAT